MSTFFAYLGVQPRCSLAELASAIPQPPDTIIDSVALFSGEIDALAIQSQLGGIIKCGEIIDTVPVKALSGELIADLMESRPRASRIIYGLTVFGGNAHQQKTYRHLALEVKKALKARGRSSRWMNGKDNEPISPAAVEKLELTTEGYDFVICLQQDQAIIGLTRAVQKADDWSERDFGKPYRDALNGMLPPKLARMMINIAKPTTSLSDPFCGSGTVLMEAAIIHPDIQQFGSDIDQKHINGAIRNLDWMAERHHIRQETREKILIFTSSAQRVDQHIHQPVETIVTEGYLGKPMKGFESLEWLERNHQDVTQLWKESLPIFARIQETGGRIVCTWPIMHSKHHQPLFVELSETELADVGYKRVHPLQIWNNDTKPIIYKRADQFVHRQIVVLERI